MRKKIIAFCPADNANIKYFEMLKNSIRKFYTEEELPLLLIDQQRINDMNDPSAFYRMTPRIARELIKEYEIVLKLDSDQIITGKLDGIFTNDYDVAVVNNSNPREFQAYSYSFMNISPYSYANCGLVAMRNESFIQWWDNACNSTIFGAGQMREQDILNYMIHSNNYNVKRLDEGDSYYGLAAKGYFTEIKLSKDELILPKGTALEYNPLGQPMMWPDKDKKIRCIHFAGGNIPNKMNYKILFQEDVVKRLDYLVKP